MLDTLVKVSKIILYLAVTAAVLFCLYVLYHYSMAGGGTASVSSAAQPISLNDQVGWLIGMVTIFLTSFGVISVLFFAVIATLLWDSRKSHQESRAIIDEMRLMRDGAKKIIEEDAPKVLIQLESYTRRARSLLVDQISIKNTSDRLNKGGSQSNSYAKD